MVVTALSFSTIRFAFLETAALPSGSHHSGQCSHHRLYSLAGGEAGTIIDNTETNMLALRRTIYLTIRSSLDYEETAHKLLKLQLKPGQEVELCHMVLDCCAQERTYEKFYGLLAQVRALTSVKATAERVLRLGSPALFQRSEAR